MEPTPVIDDHLSRWPAEQREAQQHLREMIAGLVPEAEEAISYGMPGFRYRQRPLVGYAASNAHLSFHPMGPAVIERHRGLPAEWSTSKGTIRFRPDHPLPAEVVASLMTARLAELDDS